MGYPTRIYYSEADNAPHSRYEAITPPHAEEG
jgi:hypothetical protein